MLVIIFLIFQKYCENIIPFKNFISDEKGIPHFKISPLDYSCSGVYLQNCKATESEIFLTTLCFCLNLVCQKYLNVTLTFDLSKCSHKIEFYNDACIQNPYDYVF